MIYHNHHNNHTFIAQISCDRQGFTVRNSIQLLGKPVVIKQVLDMLASMSKTCFSYSLLNLEQKNDNFERTYDTRGNIKR